MMVNSTPLWVPLIVAGIGLLGTIVGTVSGVLITQRRSDRREAAAWERERARERELWAREDVLRNFEARRDACVGFYEVLREMVRIAYDHGMGLSEQPPDAAEGELPFDWNMAAARKLEHLRIYASPDVLAAADAACNACWRWGDETRWGNDQRPGGRAAHPGERVGCGRARPDHGRPAVGQPTVSRSFSISAPLNDRCRQVSGPGAY
jgi:hypothetical protein